MRVHEAHTLSSCCVCGGCIETCADVVQWAEPSVARGISFEMDVGWNWATCPRRLPLALVVARVGVDVEGGDW